MSRVSALAVVTETGGALGVDVGVVGTGALGEAPCVEACVGACGAACVAAFGGAFSIDFFSPQPANPKKITATLNANE